MPFTIGSRVKLRNPDRQPRYGWPVDNLNVVVTVRNGQAAAGTQHIRVRFDPEVYNGSWDVREDEVVLVDPGYDDFGIGDGVTLRDQTQGPYLGWPTLPRNTEATVAALTGEAGVGDQIRIDFGPRFGTGTQERRWNILRTEVMVTHRAERTNGGEATMPAIEFYDVFYNDGRKAGQICARNKDDVPASMTEMKAAADYLKDVNWKFDETDPKKIIFDRKSPFADKPPPPDPSIYGAEVDEPPGAVEIGDLLFNTSLQKQARFTEDQNYIWVMCAPTSNPWNLGGKIKKLSDLGTNRDYYPKEWRFEPNGLVVVNRFYKSAWITGKWRPGFAKWIEEALDLKKTEQSDADFAAATKILKDMHEASLITTKQMITALETQIKQYYDQLVLWCKDKVAKERLITNFPEFKGSAKELVESVKKVKGVVSARVKGTEIIFYTEHVIIEADKNRLGDEGPQYRTTYDIGKFRCHINIQTGQTYFYNLTRKVNGTQHPHIPSPEKPCLGEAQAILPEMIAKGLYKEVVTIMMRYLRSVEIKDSAGMKIVVWPEYKPEAAKPVAPEKPKEALSKEEVKQAAPARAPGSTGALASAGRAEPALQTTGALAGPVGRLP